MLLHNYIYRLKCIVRDKQNMFWTLIFPILLATLFHLAFSNLSSAETFSKIELGIVNNTEYKENADFVKAIDLVSSSDTEKNALFDIKYTSKEEAESLLNNGEIEGYIYFQNGMKLFVKDSGIKQTIIKAFLDDYKQTSSTIQTILSKGDNLDTAQVLNSITNRNDYLKEEAASKSAPNNVVTYFYALIGMASLYGGFSGLKEVTALQANLSPQGARVNLAPTHKLKLITSSLLAATTVQLFDIFVLLGYLDLVLKVNFGSQLGYIVLTCIVGTITGVSFGTTIASIIPKSEGLKIGILISLTMIMSFLSGMMYDGMKYIISTNVPILGYLNPANLITDSLYALYYYNTYTQFYTDLTLLGVFALIFIVITYMALRRQRYASL